MEVWNLEAPSHILKCCLSRVIFSYSESLLQNVKHYLGRALYLVSQLPVHDLMFSSNPTSVFCLDLG